MPSPFTGLNPRSGHAASGLGAVGGARGVGAGVLRYLVEFATVYDASQLTQLANDLNAIDAQQRANAQQVAQLEKERAAQQKTLTNARRAESIAGREAVNRIRGILQLEKDIVSYRKMSVAQRRAENVSIGEAQRAIKTIRAALRDGNNLTDKQITTLLRQSEIQDQIAAKTAEINKLKKEGALLDQQANAVMDQGNAIVSARQALLPRLGALGLGLVGGIAGAAIITPILDAGTKAIEVLGESLQNLLDPAHKAREELSDVAAAINENAEGVNKFEAALKHIQSFGSLGENLGLDPKKLGTATALDGISDRVEQLNKDLEVQAHLDELVAEKTLAYAGTLARAQKGNRDVWEVVNEVGDATRLATEGGLGYKMALEGNTTALQNLAREGDPWAQSMLAQADASVRAALGLDTFGASAENAAQALEDLNQVRLDALTANIEATSEQNIANIERVRDAVIQAAQAGAEIDIEGVRTTAEHTIDTLQNRSEARIKALQERLGNLELVPSARTKGLEKQLDALKDAGPSKRTRELAAAIEKLNAAEKQRQRTQELADIKEERHLLLFEKRLRLTNEEIDLDKYQGKEKLIALDILQEKMQKRNEAQKRFNDLLDLQYEFSRRLEREQGESIQDFIERRAQHNRDLLQQANEIRQEQAGSTLDEQKRLIEIEVELRENAEKKKETLRKFALEDTLEKLQKQLKASQEHDQKVLESRRESLQKQLEASKKADQEALDSKRKALQDEIDAVRKTTQDRIEAVRKGADAEIKKIEEKRDRDIAAANRTADAAIAAERRRVEATLKIIDHSNDALLQSALSAAKTMGDIQLIAGQMAGFNYSEGELQAMMKAYGLDDATIAIELAKIREQKKAVYQKAARIQFPDYFKGFAGQITQALGLQSGGLFPLTNASNFRFGEAGTELGLKMGGYGMVFPNSIVQAMRDAIIRIDDPGWDRRGRYGGGDYIGGPINIGDPSRDPWRERFFLERMIRQIVRDELRRN